MVGPDDRLIEDLLARTRRIAVVGASDDPSRPSHGVMQRLQQAGFDLVPVNPNVDQVLGIPTVARLADIEGPVDLVDVFRRIQYTADVVREAAGIGAPAVWLQSGLRSAEARQIAAADGITYVENRCLAVEVASRQLQW